ncbi:biopolymer transporter ExbD [Rhodobacter sp. TJ_12]|uniref:biopolymer transporter ExbD n=1 Tax=Rhodobacter sp. TJ_12 TaxID=2029399 RepID=UPI001CBE4F1F|nr:biopolymer transporter ExbD [Rhodobacter sp. TJ_12]MBZ4021469.1 biopolymer transporter ExbD [Rhodobacter sp. TJ_12]
MRGVGVEAEEDLLPETGINLTPFIDVMLVLLIVFMVAAPLSTADVAVDLPAVGAPPVPRPAKPVVVNLQADGTLLLGHTPIAAADLPAALKEATGGDRTARLYVSGDKAVAYGEIMALLDRMRAAGWHKVGLVGLSAAP